MGGTETVCEKAAIGTSNTASNINMFMGRRGFAKRRGVVWVNDSLVRPAFGIVAFQRQVRIHNSKKKNPGKPVFSRATKR
jgi:virulence-associated protein VapD